MMAWLLRFVVRTGSLLILAGVVAAAAAAVASPVKWAPVSTWQANGRVRTVAFAGGVVYLGGEFTELVPPAGAAGSPLVRNHVAALDATTGQPLPWNPNTDGTVWSLAVSGSTVYLGGDFASVGGHARAHAAAVDTGGGAVRGWDPEPDGNVKAVAIGPNRDIYLGGFFTHVAGMTRNHLAELTPAGAATSWHPVVKQISGSTCPPRCPPFVASLAFSADGGTLYFGGHFGLVNGIGRNNAAAVSVATGETLAWNPDVLASQTGTNANQANKVWHVELGPDRAFLCGDFWSLDGFRRHPNIAAVDLTAGHLIYGFDASTDGSTPACQLVGGYLYVGGHFQRVGPTSAWVSVPGQKSTLTGIGSVAREHLAAFDAGTGAIDAWNPGMNSVLGVHALAYSGSALGVGGDFTRIAGRDQQSYAQFPG